MSKLQDLIKSQKKYEKTIRKEIIKEFKNELRLIFDKYPNVEYFSTPCYTPYFNDGDECHYTVNDYCSKMFPTPACPEELKSWHEDEELSYDEVPEHELFAPLKEYVDLIGSIPPNILDREYEEGVVKFFKDGSVDVDDYDHE